jgi:hypothetical protein
MLESLSNNLIELRQAALRLLLNTSTETLNPTASNCSRSAAELIQELKLVVNGFKAEAITDDGQRVDYQRLCQSEGYHRYIEVLLPCLHHLDLDELQTRQQTLVFWINIYNALVIHAVIAYGIHHSLRENGYLQFARFFQRAAYQIGGHRFSLDDIEHGILRANAGHPVYPGPHFAANDPRMAYLVQPVDVRIHFALNCASQSCPPIGVYLPEKIDQQLDLATRNFVDQETALKVDTLWLSMIFKWYLTDFGKKSGLVRFLLDYLPDDERRAWLLAKGESARFKYLSYDWGLNK